MTVTLYLVSQRIYPIRYEWKRIGKLTAATALIFVVGYWGGVPVWQKAALLFLFPVILLLIGFFEQSELKRIRSIFYREE
jgi:hypothetical protein